VVTLSGPHGKSRRRLYVECDNGQRTQVYTLSQAREFALKVGASSFETYFWRKGKFTPRKQYFILEEEFKMSIQGLYHLNTESDGAYGFHDEAYKAPLVFEHGKSYLVAKLEGIGSGQDVEIYESRCPARFFELVACEDETSRRFGLSFGSGMEMQKLAFGLAHAIADGMVVLNEEEQE